MTNVAQSFDWALEMSPELQRKIPQIIDLVAREIGG
jgi:hypothetical protein